MHRSPFNGVQADGAQRAREAPCQVNEKKEGREKSTYRKSTSHLSAIAIVLRGPCDTGRGGVSRTEALALALLSCRDVR